VDRAIEKENRPPHVPGGLFHVSEQETGRAVSPEPGLGGEIRHFHGPAGLGVSNWDKTGDRF